MSSFSTRSAAAHRWIVTAIGWISQGRRSLEQRGFATVFRWIAAGWRYLRTVSGDDAYERYLAHHAAAHAGETPMSRKDYFAERQRQKWSGVTRCC